MNLFVFQKTGLVKLRRVLRAIRKHFPQPPDNILSGNAIDKFLDDPDLSEDKLLVEAQGFLDSIKKASSIERYNMTKLLQSLLVLEWAVCCCGTFKSMYCIINCRSEPYLEVYSNLFYLLAQSEEMSATDKWAGFVLTKEGEEFVEQNANLFKYDLLYNPSRLESWQRLANIYDEVCFCVICH